jgi:predicted nucleotide-binding protein
VSQSVPYLFVSYAHEDVDRVRPLVEAVKIQLITNGVRADVWMDTLDLKPGEAWDATIARALEASCGFLFFVSPYSLKSEWIRKELEVAAKDEDRLLIPVILSEAALPELPTALAGRQWLRFVGAHTKEQIEETAWQIVQATKRYLDVTPQPRAPVEPGQVRTLAADIAEQVRSSGSASDATGRPDSVFVVHGHHTGALSQLEAYLTAVGVAPIILSRRDDSPQSLFQKFLMIGSKAHFAIVLLSADDYGASLLQYDIPGVGDRALQFRARQNVILELGFFYGKLGWENVFVIQQTADRAFPNFELPSDLGGVVLDSISDAGWKGKLGAKLTAAGFQLNAVV